MSIQNTNRELVEQLGRLFDTDLTNAIAITIEMEVGQLPLITITSYSHIKVNAKRTTKTFQVKELDNEVGNT